MYIHNIDPREVCEGICCCKRDASVVKAQLFKLIFQYGKIKFSFCFRYIRMKEDETAISCRGMAYSFSKKRVARRGRPRSLIQRGKPGLRCACFVACFECVRLPADAIQEKRTWFISIFLDGTDTLPYALPGRRLSTDGAGQREKLRSIQHPPSWGECLFRSDG